MICRPFSTLRGTLHLCAGEDALLRLTFPGEQFPDGAEEGESTLLEEGAAWLERYFAGKDPGEPPPCAPVGSLYRSRVWELLREIPYGERVSYRELAERYERLYGRHTSPRAVGGAVGKNPLPIFLPCHRVLGADGSLTGYAGGLEWKAWLLELERDGKSIIM